MYTTEYYRKMAGEMPAKDFIEQLPEGPQGKFFRHLELLAKYGPDLPRPYADIVEGKIRELRLIFGGNQYRLLYFFDLRKAVFTNGFFKKTDRIPPKEIGRAKKYMTDYFIRKNLQKKRTD